MITGSCSVSWKPSSPRLHANHSSWVFANSPGRSYWYGKHMSLPKD